MLCLSVRETTGDGDTESVSLYYTGSGGREEIGGWRERERRKEDERRSWRPEQKRCQRHIRRSQQQQQYRGIRRRRRSQKCNLLAPSVVRTGARLRSDEH